MLFEVDFNAATAVYRQLMEQVQRGAASGALKPRDPLPGIRPLARQLRLNRNTVAKAYGELENLGVIKMIPGKGCFMEPVETLLTPKVRREVLVAKIDAALVVAVQLEIESSEFSELVSERMELLSDKFEEIRPKTEMKRKMPDKNKPEAPAPARFESAPWSPATD